ncbi:type II secretion system major pseudopilin GspG [Jannaschia pohangensis]|uniref:Type II secretion system core protein G n=1 Tax=Jannaschia pohangensis TaxID=390807 RepID=A0A1I3JY81_9RHOB|nr:type II secretion system major pseudopilin GspG [Jannaschia pohangensis]SFI65173.1 general secretion pathway protein G [Jannaschia pohangensis]
MISRKAVTWKGKSGVTILEVLIVLSIIALIAAVAGPRLVGYLGRAKSDTAALQIGQIESAVQLFYIDVGRYPSDNEGLQVLLQAPAGTSDWDGPYLRKPEALIDPWGRGYVYDGNGEGTDFTIRTFGRDGQQGGTGEDADLSS